MLVPIHYIQNLPEKTPLNRLDEQLNYFLLKEMGLKMSLVLFFSNVTKCLDFTWMSFQS
jgi:hypothetical protein